MALFTQFMLQDGVWEGKPLLRGWFYDLAGKKQIETAGDPEGHRDEWAKGYGYQCWMNSLPGSFRADGAYGQFGLVYPSLDLCVIINAATEQTQSIIDAENDCLLPAVNEHKSDAEITGTGCVPESDADAAGMGCVPESDADTTGTSCLSEP